MRTPAMPRNIFLQSPEIELMICCARPLRDARTVARLNELLALELNWDYLFQTAWSHGMLPLLYARFHEICPEAVPDVPMQRLRTHFQENARRNLFLTSELHALLKLFAAHGLRALAYKGPALAASVYGSVSLRQFCDIDILVPRADVRQAKSLLLKRGYQTQATMKRVEENIFLRSECEEPFANSKNGHIVELQWAVTSSDFSCPLSVECLWERRASVDLIGTPVAAPGIEELMLILCVHGAKHFWSRLEWICGIAELTRPERALNWNRVLQNATGAGCRRMLFLGLQLAREILDAELPAHVVAEIRSEPWAVGMASQVRARLFRPEAGDSSDAFDTTWEKVGFPLQARERLRDKASYLVRRAIVPSREDWAALPLPVAPFFFYGWRPLRLAGKYVLQLAQHMKPPKSAAA